MKRFEHAKVCQNHEKSFTSLNFELEQGKIFLTKDAICCNHPILET